LAHRHATNENEFSEFLNEARIQLLYAMIHYSPNRNSKLHTYVFHRVNNILMSTKRNLMRIFRDHAVDNDVLDYNTSREENFSIELEDALHCLTKRERRVLMSYYIEGKSLQEIAAEIGVCFSSVYNIKSRAIKKARGAHSERQAQERKTEAVFG
jgi:RNA polymerase sigma factor (sigma-70 family)